MSAQEKYTNETISEIDPHVNNHLIYDKDGLTVQRGKS